MASSDDVKRLAALSRISLSEEERARFAKEFEDILGYVGQLESLNISAAKGAVPPVRNVFREDGEPVSPGTYTKKLTEQFPAREGDYLKVKQIISYD